MEHRQVMEIREQGTGMWLRRRGSMWRLTEDKQIHMRIPTNRDGVDQF